MLSLLTKAAALLASVQAVTGLAVPRTPAKAVEVTKRASGPVNAVYFTNWLA